jgi:hypothetical protein
MTIVALWRDSEWMRREAGEKEVEIQKDKERVDGVDLVWGADY